MEGTHASRKRKRSCPGESKRDIGGEQGKQSKGSSPGEEKKTPGRCGLKTDLSQTTALIESRLVSYHIKHRIGDGLERRNLLQGVRSSTRWQ